MKCLNCGNEFEGREGAKYCSAKCRKAVQRKCDKSVTDISVTSQNVTDKPISVTEQIQAVPGKCWCCGESIPEGTVCCGPCAWSGRAKEKRNGRYPPLLTDRTQDQMESDLHSLTLTGGYETTESELADYKPDSQLKTGEYNHVSRPGDADYNGVCNNSKYNRI